MNCCQVVVEVPGFQVGVKTVPYPPAPLMAARELDNPTKLPGIAGPKFVAARLNAREMLLVG